MSFNRATWVLVSVAALSGAVERGWADTPPAINLSTGIQVKLKTVATLSTGNAAQGIIDQGINVGDSRLFLVGRDGQVRVLNNGVVSATPFLSTSAISGVNAIPLIADTGGGERGFLGAAFSPDFNNVGTAGYRKFYSYTSEMKSGSADFFNPEIGATGGDHQSVIREWTANAAGTAIDTSIASRVVMRIAEPQSNHNGGALMFSPVDNYLYVSLGDGGGGNDNNNGVSSTTDGHTNSPGAGLAHGNAQDKTQILGKIIRIKPTIDADPNTTLSVNGKYRVPNSNPFAGATAGLDEVFAYGLRNPFRVSFDLGSSLADSNRGRLFAGDVGQGAREEIDMITSGGNYGWVIKEGTIDTSGVGPYSDPGNLIRPIAEYTHSDGIAVIGGFVYRGSSIPALQGKYVFGEYFLSGTGGRLFYTDSTTPASGLNTIFQFRIDPTGDALPGSSNRLVGFGEDSNGELYAMFSTFPSSGTNGVGTIVMLVPEPATWWLGAIGACGISLLLCRRQSSRQSLRVKRQAR